MYEDYYAEFLIPISPMTGLLQLDGIEDMEQLTRTVSGKFGTSIHRYMAYNTKPIWDLIQPGSSVVKDLEKATLGFRQHEGSLDGERITQ
jgi:hypothetical protein